MSCSAASVLIPVAARLFIVCFAIFIVLAITVPLALAGIFMEGSNGRDVSDESPKSFGLDLADHVFWHCILHAIFALLCTSLLFVKSGLPRDTVLLSLLGCALISLAWGACGVLILFVDGFVSSGVGVLFWFNLCSMTMCSVFSIVFLYLV